MSNLKFTFKVLEKVVATQLSDHFSDNHLVEPYQSVYKRCYGTETALTRVSNDILHAVDSKQALFLVLLDLSSAFDTVDHLLLVKCPKSCGVEGIALEWLSSYLADRSQSVKISESTSSPAALNFGVPQGSVLGPLSFSIYFSPVANIAH